MSANIGNSVVTFGDGTTITSANMPYTSISGAPTQLSQFTNDLGNYGGFYSSANIDTTSTGYGGAPAFQFKIVSGNVRFVVVNCNCQCNC